MNEFLICDEPNCDHVETVGVITAQMVGMSCPKCGANLLSQSDYDVYAAYTRPLMDLSEQLGLTKPATADEVAAGVGLISVNYHDGETRIRTTPNPDKETQEKSK